MDSAHEAIAAELDVALRRRVFDLRTDPLARAAVVWLALHVYSDNNGDALRAAALRNARPAGALVGVVGRLPEGAAPRSL